MSNDTESSAPSRVRNRDRQVFGGVLVLTLVLRALLAVNFPFTGDEAYYWDWGRHLAGGYYDQPPMVGWLLSGLQRFSHHLLVLRLPALLLPPALAFCWMSVIRRWREPDSAWLTGTLILLLPWSFLNVLITTDTPLLLFMALSIFFFLRALRCERPARADLLLAGLLGGAGFLSKYFVVLLLPVFAGALLLVFRDPAGRRLALPRIRTRGIQDLAIILAGAAPAAIWHLYWNYENCWINFVFNLVSRNGNEDYNLRTPLIFAGHQLYLLAPLLLLAPAAFRRLRNRRAESPGRIAGIAFAAFAVGVGAFGLSSLKHGQGLHWTLGFHAPLWLGLGLSLSAETLRRLVRPLALFTGLHAAAVALLLLFPVETWRDLKDYRHLVFLKHPAEVAAAIDAALPRDAVLASNSYTLSSVLGWTSGGSKDIPLFLNASKFGRQSDFLHDWSARNGETVAIFSLRKLPKKKTAKYFLETEVRRIRVRGAGGYLTIGRGFRFEEYRKGFLAKIRRRFYRLPAGIPCGGCGFVSRYFPGETASGG